LGIPAVDVAEQQISALIFFTYSSEDNQFFQNVYQHDKQINLVHPHIWHFAQITTKIDIERNFHLSNYQANCIKKCFFHIFLLDMSTTKNNMHQ